MATFFVSFRKSIHHIEGVTKLRGLTNRWSARVQDKVPSPSSSARGAKFNR
jgi:hypothetical protein